MTDFVSYPRIDDPEFYDKIIRKKEFLKTYTGPEFHTRDPEEACRPGEFRMQNHQEFVRNFISPVAPNNGLLLFHSTGTGKTCASISITEGLRDYAHKLGKKIYVISSEAIADNFYRELYSEDRAQREKLMHSPPGSFQCAGDRYHISELDEPNPEKRLKKIKAQINKYYSFITPHSFPNEVDVKLRGRIWDPSQPGKTIDTGLNDKEIAEYFQNSVFIIDEAHGIAGVGKAEASVKRKARKAKAAETEEAKEQDPPLDEFDDVADFMDDQVLAVGPTRKKPILSNRSFLEVLLSIIEGCSQLRKEGKKGHLKLVLLTATPMKDNQNELADLLEVLNRNDDQEFDRKMLFPDDTSFNRDYLVQKARGYVSYVRGNNPVTFPRPRLPPAEQLYEPEPLFSIIGDKSMLPESQYQINLAEEDGEVQHYSYNLVKCPMSIFQWKAFLLIDENMKQSVAQSYIRQASNFVFPTTNLDEVVSSEAYPIPASAKRYAKLYGKPGMDTVFTDKSHSLAGLGAGRAKTHHSKEYTDDALARFGFFLMQENPLNPEVTLATCSAKFNQIVSNINSQEGISYCYSEFDAGSVKVLAMALEANGFILYNPAVKYNQETGLPSNLDDVPQSRLLSYTSTQNKTLYQTHLKHNYRCAVCGQLYHGARYNHDPKRGEVDHRFIQACYLLFTGSFGSKKSVDIMRSFANINGHVVKAILGTQVTSEGIDFKYVRQVHVIEPWHNNTKIYQAIGRGIRHCSHIDLPPDQRNVTVFKYSSAAPELEIEPSFSDEAMMLIQPLEQLMELAGTDSREDLAAEGWLDDMVVSQGMPLGFSYRTLLMETADEMIYNRVVTKDIYIKKIERVLKQIAIDCKLNRHINYYGESDLDYTRECDYQKCNYQCIGYTKEVVLPLPADQVDQSTYTAYFAAPQISRAQSYIVRLFQQNVALDEKTISFLVHQRDPSIDLEFIHIALDQLIGNPPQIAPKELRDRYNRSGYLIMAGPYYVFQPISVKDTTVPTYYRSVPLTGKPQSKPLEKLVSRKDVTEVAAYKRDPIKLDQIINELYQTVQSYTNNWETYESEGFILNLYLGMVVHLRMRFDRLVLSDQAYVFKKVVSQAEVEVDENWSILKTELFKYLSQQFLATVFNDNIYLLLEATVDTVDSFQDGAWSTINLDVERNAAVQKHLSEISTVVPIVNTKFSKEDQSSGIYGYLAPGTDNRAVSVLKDSLAPVNLNKVLATVTRTNTYIVTDRHSNSLQFKIVNKRDETHKLTKAGTSTSKTQAKGISCKSNTEAKLTQLLDTLTNVFEDEEEQPSVLLPEVLVEIMGDLRLDLDIDTLQGTEGTHNFYNTASKPSKCTTIEFILRLLDYAEYKDRRWFLSPFEIEFYRPRPIKA